MDNTSSLHDVTVERLARWIAGGRYGHTGALPNEAELCEELGVSRTIVREAIRTLSAKGMLRSRARSGTRVQPPREWQLLDRQILEWRLADGATPDIIRDIIDFRLGIEPQAARLCARRRVDTGSLFDALVEMKRSLDGVGNYSDADLKFHSFLLEGAGNQFLSQLVPFIGGVLKLSFSLSAPRETARETYGQHELVARAVQCGDENDAYTAMEGLIEMARRSLMGRKSGIILGGVANEPDHGGSIQGP